MTDTAGRSTSTLPVILMGTAATLLGVGLARFAFTAIFPGLILQGWFSDVQTAYIASSNLVAYITGAWSAALTVKLLSPRRTLLLAAAVVSCSFIACAYPLSFEWMLVWRALSGWAGAILMVVAPPLVMSHLPVEKRSAARAVVFTGLGLGIFLSGSLVPWLVEQSLLLTWWILFAIALLMSGWIYRFAQNPPAASHVTSNLNPHFDNNKTALLAVYVAYGLDAIGFVPHTVFWFDFLVRNVGLSLGAASFNLALLGVGAMCGAVIAGALAQRVGWAKTVMIAVTLKMIAVGLPLFSHHVIALALSAALVGAFIPGMVVSVSGRIGELTSPRQQIVAWGRATMLFALCQGGAALLYAKIYVSNMFGIDGATMVFMLSTGSLVLALLVLGWSQRQFFSS